MYRIGIIGSGPTAIYALKGLLDSTSPLDIVIFEKTGTAGTGMPYRHGTNHSALLANIASIELPAVLEPLHHWLRARTEKGLELLGIDRREVTDRAFFPRVTIGTYFRDQLVRLSEKARLNNHRVTIKVRHEVTDVKIDATAVSIIGISNGEATFVEPFDHVVIATGHTLGVTNGSSTSYLESPYPTSQLDHLIPGSRIGILGTSLSAIDAAIVIALKHGDFIDEDGLTSYKVNAGAKLIDLTMMSRGGFLPEADFYCSIPYEPTAVFTREALHAIIEAGAEGLLDRAMALFAEQLVADDPVYAKSLDLLFLTADSFPAAYFAPRLESEPFHWARANLDEVMANHARRFTVPWRYSLLRMHEIMEAAVQHFNEQDRKRFDVGLRRVFVDNYAAIPPQSVQRLLALHAASALKIIRLGENYEQISDGEAHHVIADKSTYSFDVVIDARGEGPLTDDNIPFLGLRPHLARLNAARRASGRWDQGRSGALSIGKLHIGSLPYLLADRPFIQGLVACEEVGSEIALSIVAALANDAGEDVLSLRDLIRVMVPLN